MFLSFHVFSLCHAHHDLRVQIVQKKTFSLAQYGTGKCPKPQKSSANIQDLSQNVYGVVVVVVVVVWTLHHVCVCPLRTRVQRSCAN